MSNSEPNDKRRRLLNRLFVWIVVLVVVVLILGVVGFRYIVHLNWIDSFQNAAFYVSGMGPVAEMKTSGQKVFSGIYSLLAGLLFIAVAAYLIDQIISIEYFQDLLS